MSDFNAQEHDHTSNNIANLLAIVGMVLSIALQMVYFNFFGIINWGDGIVVGVLAGACILAGFKLGKGVSGKTFPVFLVVIAVLTVVLGVSLGITFLVYNIGGFTLGEAFLLFFDEYLFADIQGTTLYHSQGIIDMGVAIGIAILIVGGKYFVGRSANKKQDNSADS